MIAAFADTFFYIALLDRTDPAHLKVAAFATTFAGRIVTTDWVLLEVADGLARTRAGREQFARLRADLLAETANTQIVPCDPGTFDDGIDLYTRRPDKKWSLTDCISFVVMNDMGLTDALTADHHFAQAGFSPLLL